MRIFSGAIALGLLMGLPVGVLVVESTSAQEELTQAPQNEKKAEAERLFEQGVQQNESSQYQEARQSWEAALELFRELGDRTGESAALSKIGVAYIHQGQYDQALDYHQQALTIAREIGDRAEEAIALNGIGWVKVRRGEYAQALEHYQQALAIAREVGERLDEARSLQGLGSLYWSQGQHTQALEYYQQVLAIAQEVGNRAREGGTLADLGAIYSEQGQLTQALEHYQQSLAIVQEVSDRHGEGYVLQGIGLVYRAQGQDAQALDYYQQALAIHREVGDRGGEGSILISIGVVYCDQGQYAQALKYFQQVLAIYQEIGGSSLESHTLTLIGVAYNGLGREDKALAYFRQSIEVSETVEHNVLANDQSRIAFFENRTYIYSALEESLIAQDKIAESLEIADRSRARSLIQFLTPSTNDQPREPLNIEQIKRLARAKNATLITYSISGEASSTSGEDLYIWVVSPNGDLNFAKANPEEAGVPVAQVARRSRAAVTSRGLSDIIFSQDPYRLAQAIRGSGTNGLRAGSPENLERGYDLLIKPIEQYLPKQRESRLIIVPHRELGTIPFTALFKKGQGFFIDRYTVTITPSLQILDTLQQTKPTATGAPLVMGNPSPMVGNLSPLPGTEAEATAIAQKLNTEPILGDQATEATIKSRLANASILHLATHGVIQKSDRDSNSWLALADRFPDGIQDNKLTISEIFGSELNAQIAVLSACDTNSGQTSGEGVVSLARAFLKAGVPTVVASSWKVPDQQTRMLMEEFYDQLLAGKTYAQALRSAQIKVRAEFPNPFYWAAFTVIGEGDRTLELP